MPVNLVTRFPSTRFLAESGTISQGNSDEPRPTAKQALDCGTTCSDTGYGDSFPCDCALRDGEQRIAELSINRTSSQRWMDPAQVLGVDALESLGLF